MTEWFAPETGRWFALLSLLGLLAGCAPWIQKGLHRKLVTTVYAAALGLGVALLASGLIARVAEQPGHVVRTLLIAGIVITVVFAGMIAVVRQGYAEAEKRRMLAKDL